MDSVGNVIGYHYDCVIYNINLIDEIFSTITIDHCGSFEESQSKGIDKVIEILETKYKKII